VTQPDKKQKLTAALDAFQAAKAAEGDAQAFDLLYRRWHPRLLRFAQRLTRHQDDARDVMQETALTLAKDIHKLRDPSRFSAWAYTIVRRRAADHIYRAVRRRSAESELAEILPVSPVETDLALRQALSQLSETDRLILTLFYIDGFRGADISAALGVPVGTVKSRLYTARTRLKSIYDDTEGDMS